MEQYQFSNSNIDLACEQVGDFLARAGVDRREALRIKLTFEEVLLDYQAKLGEAAVFKLRLVKRLSSVRVGVIVPGEAFDPLDKPGEEDDVIRGLLAGIGLAPSWSYKGSANHVVFVPKKKTVSGAFKTVVAVGLAVVCGVLLKLLPDRVAAGVTDYVLTPVNDAFLGLITAVSVPLVFLSILSSICSMGNVETLDKIGSKTVKAVLLHMVAISVFMTGLGALFFRIEAGDGTTAGLSQILEMIYDIIPSNLFEPFLTDNTLQLIFISVIMGLAMLVLSSKVGGVFGLISDLEAIMQAVMSGICSLLPALVFVIFTGMIASGDFGTLLRSWKMLAIIFLLLGAFYVIHFVRIAVRKKVPLALLLKKIRPTFMIAFMTASSAAAFGTNLRDTNKKLGVQKTLADFGIPIGQVLFDPAGIAVLIGIELTMAELYGIPITPSFLAIAMVTNFLLSIASPPVPGGAMMCYAIAFAQLGIPMETIGVVLVVDMILDFPATACNVSSWQLAMIEVADSLNMLDKEALCK